MQAPLKNHQIIKQFWLQETSGGHQLLQHAQTSKNQRRLKMRRVGSETCQRTQQGPSGVSSGQKTFLLGGGKKAEG